MSGTGFPFHYVQTNNLLFLRAIKGKMEEALRRE